MTDSSATAAPTTAGSSTTGSTGPSAPTNPSAPARRRRRIPVLARVVSGAVGVALVAGAATAAIAAPPGEAPIAAPSVEVTPASPVASLVCPGLLLQLGPDGAPVAVPGGDVVAAGEAAPAPLLTSTTGASASVFTAPGSAVDGSAAAQSTPAATEQLAGFAAASCDEPSGDQWLAAGSTTTGRTSILVIGNPTGVAATVALEVSGEQGLVETVGTSGIAVPAGGQIALPLAAYAPGLASPVVRVQSRGGSVTASMQTSAIRGITPGGVDTVPSLAPAERLVIPGVRVSTEAGVQDALLQTDGADLQPVLRLMTTGDEAVDARVGVDPVGVGGTGSELSARLEPGVAVDLPLAEVPEGLYTVTVDADAPLVGSVRTSTVGDDGTIDSGWYVPAERLSGTAALAVAPGAAATLVLADPAGAPRSVTLTGPDGAATTVEVPAGASVAVDVTAGAHRLQGAAGLVAAVSLLGDGALAAYPVPPASAASRPVTVYP